MKTIKNIKNGIMSLLLPWAQENPNSPEKYQAKQETCFELKYKNKIIGYLEYKGKKCIFKYSDEFKKAPFTSITNFPNLDKIYEFDELPPFFAARIPTLNQPFHYYKLKKYHGDKDDLVTLLEIFGRRSINNPFELVKR